jgi:hypothetical protein
MNGLADAADPRPSSPSSTRYGTTRDRAANRRLFRLVAEVLAAIEAGVFPPRVGWHLRTARCGAGAGRGGEGTRPPRRQGPSQRIRSRSLCIPSGTGSRVGRVTGPLGNRASAWACGLARRRGTGPALPRGHASGLVSAGDLSTPPARADRALPGDRDAPPDVPRVPGRGGRDRRLAGVRAARVRGVPQVWPARARSAARAL